MGDWERYVAMQEDAEIGEFLVRLRDDLIHMEDTFPSHAGSARVCRIAVEQTLLANGVAPEELEGDLCPEVADSVAERRAGCYNPDWTGDVTTRD